MRHRYPLHLSGWLLRQPTDVSSTSGGNDVSVCYQTQLAEEPNGVPAPLSGVNPSLRAHKLTCISLRLHGKVQSSVEKRDALLKAVCCAVENGTSAAPLVATHHAASAAAADGCLDGIQLSGRVCLDERSRPRPARHADDVPRHRPDNPQDQAATPLRLAP